MHNADSSGKRREGMGMFIGSVLTDCFIISSLACHSVLLVLLLPFDRIQAPTRLVRKVRIGIGGPGRGPAAIAAHRPGGRGVDYQDDVTSDYIPVIGVTRTGIPDNDVAGSVHVDAAVGADAVVALNAVVGAADGGVDARAVGRATSIEAAGIVEDQARAEDVDAVAHIAADGASADGAPGASRDAV